MSPIAVYTGRYQPPHIGHMSLLSLSLERLQIPHLIVIAAYHGWSSADSSYAIHADRAYEDQRNPLSAWERYRLFSLSLDGLGLSRSVSVIMAPRHDMADWVVTDFYPQKRLICVTDKDAFDVAKVEYWRKRGEDVYVLQIPSGDPPLTTSEIKRRVAQGDDWRKFIVPRAHDYFESVEGPRRVFERLP